MSLGGLHYKHQSMGSLFHLRQPFVFCDSANLQSSLLRSHLCHVILIFLLNACVVPCQMHLQSLDTPYQYFLTRYSPLGLLKLLGIMVVWLQLPEVRWAGAHYNTSLFHIALSITLTLYFLHSQKIITFMQFNHLGLQANISTWRSKGENKEQLKLKFHKSSHVHIKNPYL